MIPTVYIGGDMAEQKEKTVAIHTNVRESIRDEFSRFCREKGEIQADTLGRLIEWFIGLDEPVRLLVMSKLKNEEAQAVARIALERLIANEAQPHPGFKAPLRKAAKAAPK